MSVELEVNVRLKDKKGRLIALLPHAELAVGDEVTIRGLYDDGKGQARVAELLPEKGIVLLAPWMYETSYSVR